MCRVQQCTVGSLRTQKIEAERREFKTIMGNLGDSEAEGLEFKTGMGSAVRQYFKKPREQDRVGGVDK